MWWQPPGHAVFYAGFAPYPIDPKCILLKLLDSYPLYAPVKRPVTPQNYIALPLGHIGMAVCHPARAHILIVEFGFETPSLLRSRSRLSVLED